MPCAYKGALVPCERKTYVYFDRVDFIDGGHITRRCEATPNNFFQPLLSWPFPFSATISGGVDAVFAHVRLLLSSFPRPTISRPRDRWFSGGRPPHYPRFAIFPVYIPLPSLRLRS